KKEILIKPQTFMNLSGLAVVRAENFFKIEREKIVIIYDDVALPFSAIRVRERGSEGGHNGLKSITQNLGTNDYARIRIGVGAPVSSEHLKNYVLGDFYDEDLAALKTEIFPKVEDALKLVVSAEIKEAMNRYNERNRAEI
ncbi:MAG: aminoacyl-tRNA hydrolase, partial [Spirochaetes bacterium]|nr:aminoacyl-tRNA hydrolase [Spirochaetota bacterium]